MVTRDHVVTIRCVHCGDTFTPDEMDAHRCAERVVERRACPTCLRVIGPDMKPERVCALRRCPANPDGLWKPV